MNTPIEFFAIGLPKGQPRARAFAFAGRARMYDPGTAEAWKSQIAMAVRDLIPAEPLNVPLAVSIRFYFPRPKSHYGTGAKAFTRKPIAPDWHTAKPDADNAAKAVLDALTTLRVWRDDSLVVRLTISKQYEQQLGTGALITINDAAI